MSQEQHKRFYAAHCMGANFTYDSPCWTAHAFHSAKERDAWLEQNKYSQGNLVAKDVDHQIACKIAPDLRNNHPENSHRVTHH